MARRLQLWHILIIGAVLIVATPMLLRYGTILQQTIISEQPGEPPTGTVPVNKILRLSVIDKFAGSVVTGATVKIYDGQTLLETATDNNDGTYDTALTYPSGKELNVYVAKSTAKMWKTITVPYMTEADAAAATVNTVNLDFFTRSSLTMTVIDGDGNSYSNGGSINKTSGGTPGKSLITLTVSLYVSSDNTGFISSYDPINQLNWYPLLTAKTTGTNYENVVVSGFAQGYEKGTNMYYVTKLADTDVTKYKVGNNYVYPGSSSFTFTLDLSGYSGDAADLVLTVYFYADSAYHQAKGSWGPDSVSIVTSTLNLVD
ncbi:hypothetical protein DRO69_02000 [Candidatus Bathyarchaeota archaeon]|nr:MAG: hypothetical protein DRO69_02000 [Candidatus Bathyarchaeota archaeon]